MTTTESTEVGARSREVSLVAVCVTTCRRPLWLGACLESVSRLIAPSSRQIATMVLVVDNDPNGAGAQVAHRAAAFMPWPLRYVVEPRRGLSFARNRAILEARVAQADFVAFLDDDEVASAPWLRELLSVQRGYAADVVTGPVLPRYEDGVPGWAIRGRFFDRPRCATGTLLTFARTGNCLISTRTLAGMESPFAARFSMSGGEDTHLFRILIAAGARIVWADEAIVEEHVPAARARVAWLVRRAFAGGSSFTISSRELEPATRWVPMSLARAAWHTVAGIVLLSLALLRGRAAMVRAFQRFALGAGCIAGMLGIGVKSYSRIVGR